MLRALWIAGGLAALAAGAVGVVVPLLPTVPFLLLAAWCFARGSPRCAAWLERAPVLGRLLADHRRRGGVTRAQRAAALALALGGVALGAAALWPPPPWTAAALGAAAALVAAIILRLPAARAPQRPP